MMDYKLLEALGCVIEEQGFDKAARKLCLTQSAVSQRIKLLEEQAGRLLLTRTVPPGATAEGRRLIKHYRQVKTLETDLNDTLKQKDQQGLEAMAVGINADSLATWFMPAVEPFLKRTAAVLDLKVDDQDRTHNMLRNGEVTGCVSSAKKPVQGCRAVYIGTMTYRLAATPGFIEKYGIRTLDEQALLNAPAVIFNRKDDLHEQFFTQYFEKPMPRLPVHYIPSSESFAGAIISGIAYGMIPDLQGRDYIEKGALVDLAPQCPVRVDLYWHCWNIRSARLMELSNAIVKNAVIW